MGAVGFSGQAISVLFLWLSGDTCKRKLVKLTGPSLSNKKITVKLLDDINSSIQRFMFMLLVTKALAGVLTWIALRWIGLENAGAWGVASGVLHVMPYVGGRRSLRARPVSPHSCNLIHWRWHCWSRAHCSQLRLSSAPSSRLG